MLLYMINIKFEKPRGKLKGRMKERGARNLGTIKEEIATNFPFGFSRQTKLVEEII